MPAQAAKAGQNKGLQREGGMMRVLVAVLDPVRLGFLCCLLRDAGVEPLILDSQISALEGGIGAFPRRLAVRDADAVTAMAVLRDAGELPSPS